MKFIELCETDEWTNQDITLDHLFRVQKARCLEYVRYFNSINYQHFSDWGTIDFNKEIQLSSKTFSSSVQFQKVLERFKDLSPQVIDKIIFLHARMRSAKEAFEKAGGKFNGHYI